MVRDFIRNSWIRIQKAVGAVMMRVPKYPWIAFSLILYGLVSFLWDVWGLFR